MKYIFIYDFIIFKNKFQIYLNRFCSTNTTWYKVVKDPYVYGNVYNQLPKESGYNHYENLKYYLKNTCKFSDKMIDLLMKNSTEENWPEGFKTAELRIQNKEKIKQLKGLLYFKKISYFEILLKFF